MQEEQPHRGGGERERRRAERLRRALYASFPLLGSLRRRRALTELERAKEDPRLLPLLVEAADSTIEGLGTTCRRLLGSLRGAPAVDALCELAIGAPDGTAAKIAEAAGLRPSAPERACLFLFVTRQLDAYFDEDYEFQNLRLEYDRADADGRARILSVLRSGDLRLVGFFGARKRLAACSAREIMLALDSFRRHRDNERFFQAFLELPLKYGLPILAELTRTGWQPDDPQHRSLLKKAIATKGDHVYPPPGGDTAPGALVDDLLRRGAQTELVHLPEAAVLERLRTASPSAGVALVGALGSRPSVSLHAARVVRESPHWLVRLAGLAVGLFPDLTADEVKDSNYWVEAFAPKVPVLEFWPQRGTPAHLEALAAAPAPCWQGPLGAARRVLQLLLAHRTTTANFEEMVVEAEVFAGSFEVADDEDDWGAGPGEAPSFSAGGGP